MGDGMSHGGSGAYALRAAAPADARAIAAIYAESVAVGDSTCDTVAPGPESFAESVGAPGVIFLVAVAGDEVVGWGRIKPWSPRPGYATTGETSTFVARAHLRRGLGSRLKQALIARAPAVGYHHLVARCFSHNTASIALNLRLGFEIVGVQRQVARAGGRWVDVTILQRLFDSPTP